MYSLAISKTIRIQPRHIYIGCRKVGQDALAESEYSETPLYPPIEDISLQSKLKRKKIGWHQKIEKLPTVEQKMIELNMPKYYGFWSVLLKDKLMRPTCSLEFLKFVTRTKIVESFPNQYYQEHEDQIQQAVNSVRKPISDLIVLHFGSNKAYRQFKSYKSSTLDKEKAQNQNFIFDLNNVLMSCLRKEIPHLSPAAVDLRPRIEGFWFVGGFEPTNRLRRAREGREHTKCMKDEPVDVAMRSSVRPTLALRSEFGLPEVVAFDATSGHFSVPNKQESEVALQGQLPTEAIVDEPEEEMQLSPYDTDPRSWGFPCRMRKVVIVPGFWPGEKNEHGQLLIHSRERINEWMRYYGVYGQELKRDMLLMKAVHAGFTQAHSYALYQGFTPVNEMTYPITQQYISTDGKDWQFGLYQLNTCCLHSEFSLHNPRNNFLWLSEDMSLFDRIEGTDVKGLNEDVLKILCSMYLKKGEPRQDAHPYLADYKYLMHHEAPDEYKEEFQKFLHNVLSERPPSQVKPEIQMWEKIYKVWFKTRHMDKKLKFFENRWAMNPATRRLDDYQPKYIPKIRRHNIKIKFMPRINSEHLFKHDSRFVRRWWNLYEDDEIAFKTLNIRKDTPPYYTGIKWSRARIPTELKV